MVQFYLFHQSTTFLMRIRTLEPSLHFSAWKWLISISVLTSCSGQRGSRLQNNDKMQVAAKVINRKLNNAQISV